MTHANPHQLDNLLMLASVQVCKYMKAHNREAAVCD